MDNLQPPPDDLRQAWLDPEPSKEKVEMIVTQTLRDAQKFRNRTRAMDIAVVIVYALSVPFLLLFTVAFWDEYPYLAAGYAVWMLTMLCGLGAYFLFFRSLREIPAYDITSVEYAAHSIDYLDRRERFLVRSATPISILMAAAGILFACASVKGADSLYLVILSFVTQPLAWGMTLDMQRRTAKRRSRLSQILADLNR